MRVITGTARGRKLITTPGQDVRPTSDMVKEAMFSIVQNEIPAAKVLDLFAGSGQLGIEALSRGAAHVVFVDAAKASVEVVRQNLEHTQFEEESRVVMMDAKLFLLSNKETFDIIFLDPPYNEGIIDAIVPSLASCINDKGIIVCESNLKEVLPDAIGTFTRKKEYKYGRIKLTTYRQEE